MVRELCKYRFRAAFGVWALWCGGAPFGRFPSRLRRRGSHLGGGGGAVGRESAGHCARGLGDRRASAGHYARGRPPLPSPSPTLRSALRPSAGKVHGRRQAGAGRTHSATPISGRRHGRRQAVAGRTHGQERGLPCALPPLRTMIRHTNGRGRGRRRADAGRTHGATPISGRGRGRRRADAGRTHGTSPISGRRHGRRQAVAGRTHGQERGLPCALPPLRTMIRHTNGRGRGRRRADAGRTHGATPISGRGRGRRRADAGRTHGTSPISGRRHGRRQAVAGRTHGQERGLPCALPPLRSALRPSAGRGAAVDKLTRGERTGRSGDSLVHFRLCAQ